jgi:murein DD-endopeptidase MepM/ murein hydrolase activator NlpD
VIRLIGAATACGALLLCGGTAAGAALTPHWTPSGFARPVVGARITQGFGCTAAPFEPAAPACPGGHFHSGIDLGAALGTPVYATASGVVIVDVSSAGFGLHVIIDHGNGLSSLYGHLSAVTVFSGMQVSGGEQIGAVGSTGNSTGPHLHFEIRRDGMREDPMLLVQLP